MIHEQDRSDAARHTRTCRRRHEGSGLKIIQEAITLTIFAVFAWLYLGETMRLNHAVACVLLFGAVAAAFWKP